MNALPSVHGFDVYTAAFTLQSALMQDSLLFLAGRIAVDKFSLCVTRAF